MYYLFAIFCFFFGVLYAETIGVSTFPDKLIVYNVFILQILLALKGFLTDYSSKKDKLKDSKRRRRMDGKGFFVDTAA